MIPPWCRRSWHILRRKLRTLARGAPQHPEFIQAAHYFSDGWPLNVWQVARPAAITDELRAIMADGFNTVILVVPWRGFQTDQLEPAYDPFHVRQLERVLGAADKLGLSVIVRVAYSHSILLHNTPNGVTQAQRLLLDEDTREAWLHYLRTVHGICREFRSFRGGFLCWEEFWHAFGKWQLRKKHRRQELAELTGFLSWLREQGVQGLDTIPKAESEQYAHYHRFANARIREYYELAREAFPDLLMECRVDKDALYREGAIEWLDNDDYRDIEAGRYTYWAPFMGARNEGEKLSAADAEHLLRYMLEEVTGAGTHTNHVVDQFNFVDDAPRFVGVHAEIQPQEVAPFLELAAPLLRHFSRGYGVWAYRDYRQNILYNPRFLMGLRGWEVARGRCRVRRRGGARLGSDSILRQSLPALVAGLQRAVSFTELILRVDCPTAANAKGLRARINAGSWHSLASVESDVLEVAIPVDFGVAIDEGVILELYNEGAPLTLDTVCLYHYVFRARIRQEDGRPGPYHSATVAFNERLRNSAMR